MLSDHKSEEALVSVILPCYNAEKYVLRAVSSIMNQSYRRLEIIVIDDCSTDGTRDILERLQTKDNRILYIKNNTNLKLVESLNIGIRISTGKYIARMDADDESLPDRIRKQVSFLESNDHIGLLGGYIEEFYSSNNVGKVKRIPVLDAEIRSYLLVASPFFHPTVMMRRSVLIENNLFYDGAFYRSEDYKMWIDILANTQGANLPEVLLKYRVLESSETRVAEKNLGERLSIASKIHKDILLRLNVTLDEMELLIYTSSMNRAQLSNITAITGKNPTTLIRIFDKIISSLDYESGLDVDMLKNYYGERVIVFLIYSRAFLTWDGFKGMFSIYSLLGIKKILTDKF